MTQPLWFAPMGVQKQKNVYFRARCKVLAEHGTTLQIAAESLYRLFLNGEMLGEGPARGTKTLSFFDEYNLAPLLREGDNWLTVEVCCFNYHNFKFAPLRPALWTNFEAAWQVQITSDWRADVPEWTWQTGYCEWRDTRCEPLGWKTAQDAGEWQNPEWFALEKTLLPRDIPALARTNYFASAIALVGALEPLPDSKATDFARHMSEEPLLTHAHADAIAAQLLAGKSVTLERDTALILDFERAITGGLSLEIESAAGTIFDIGYEEILVDERLRVYRPDQTSFTYAFADRFIARGGKQTLEPTLNERGFRFVEIAVRNVAAPVTIRAITAHDRRYPTPKITPFQCDEPLLNRIYEVSVATMSACATDTIIDCPWRESAFWVNDFVVEAPFWMGAFGDTKLIERCFRLLLSQNAPDGLVPGACPAGAGENLVFVSTNTFLPLVLRDLRDQQGEWQSFVEPVLAVMRALQQYEDKDSLLVSPAAYWNFLDWSYPLSGHEIGARASAAQNWFYILALDAVAELTGETSWTERADKVLVGLQKRFWDSEHGVYREFDNEPTVMKLAQALALLSGRCEAQKPLLLAALENEAWIEPELYMLYFQLRALVANQKQDAALQLIRRFWGPIVESGSPTIWEANVHGHGKTAMNNSGSLCHGFACAPLLILPMIFGSEINRAN